MEGEQRNMWAKALLLKIHVITGWVIPDSTELLNILIDQFQKKLEENYPHLNVDEIEFAFRQSGTTIKDWGKQMNLALIDEVLIPYTDHRVLLSRDEERKAPPPEQKIYTQAQLDDFDREDVENFYQRCRNGQIPYSLPEYFKDILVKDGLMSKDQRLEEFFQHRLGKGSEKIYEKVEPPTPINLNYYMEKIKIIELDIEVEDVSEYNDEAEEILTAFCKDLEDKGMTRMPEDDEERSTLEDMNGKCFWTTEASSQIEAETDRLYKIGEKYFGQTLDLDISTPMFKEP